MRYLLVVVSFLLFSCSGEKEVPYDRLVERDGVVFEVNSTTPFNGFGVEYHPNGQLNYKVNVEDGYGVGNVEVFDSNGYLTSFGRFEKSERTGCWSNLQSNKITSSEWMENDRTHGYGIFWEEEGSEGRGCWISQSPTESVFETGPEVCLERFPNLKEQELSCGEIYLKFNKVL